MPDAEAPGSGGIASFGPFQLVAPKRLLLRDHQPVAIGSRALDILILLVEHSGDVVSRKKIIEHVWPDLTVEDATLRVHVASLRKVLGDGKDGARYVANIPGRGYCFVTQIELHIDSNHVAPMTFAAAIASAATSRGGHRLPPRLARMIGRADEISALTELVLAKRFLSVVGAGGMGKTTVAIFSAHELLDAFDEAVFFVDFAALADDSLVSIVVSSAVGTTSSSVDPLSELVEALKDRRLLLVLDNCEHVADAVASLAERLFTEAPGVHLLATSREALRVEGEYVYILQPLDSPPGCPGMTVEDVMTYSAVQLFMDRAAASGYHAELTEGDVQTVVQVCRSLDGIALAIELAASRIGTYGMAGTADLLDHSFKLLWRGRRNALPRHQTLEAMHDWSFNLLSDRDREVLANLSVFAGLFTIAAARSVAGRCELDIPDVDRALASLTDRSLIATSVVQGNTYFRLLDTTRAYARMKLNESGDQDRVLQRHAQYYSRVLDPAQGPLPRGNEVSGFATHLGNIRAALEWSFSRPDNGEIGVELAARGTQLLRGLGLLRECERWSECGLAALRESDLGTVKELALQESLAIATMFTRANGDNVRAAIERGLYLAELLGEREKQLDLLAGLHTFLNRLGDFHGSLHVAERSAEVASLLGGATSVAVAEWMLGTSYHLVGNHTAARHHCEAGLRLYPATIQDRLGFFGYDHRIRALVTLARSLWMHGLPDQAEFAALQAVAHADRLEHPADVCIALIYATTVLLWRGDGPAAEVSIHRLIDVARDHSLGPYHVVGLALKGEHSVSFGQLEDGIEQLRSAIAVLRIKRHNVLMGHFEGVLGRALTRAQQFLEASAVVENALATSIEAGGSYELPDLLRTKGELHLASGNVNSSEAEESLLKAIQCAELQAAPSAKLRAAIPLASHWLATGRRIEAHDLLISIYSEFTEGFGTVDLRRAAHLLAEIKQDCKITN
jgi:predicted ATPase/DNA-binding winged helix-turn-helix (wHTH) protein